MRACAAAPLRRLPASALGRRMTGSLIGKTPVLKIGRFAQLAGVTVKTLRFYDSVGLFQPAGVVSESGYRLYHLGQLPALRRIRWLRELGHTLHDFSRHAADEDAGEGIQER